MQSVVVLNKNGLVHVEHEVAEEKDRAVKENCRYFGVRLINAFIIKVADHHFEISHQGVVQRGVIFQLGAEQAVAAHRNRHQNQDHDKSDDLQVLGGVYQRRGDDSKGRDPVFRVAEPNHELDDDFQRNQVPKGSEIRGLVNPIGKLARVHR